MNINYLCLLALFIFPLYFEFLLVIHNSYSRTLTVLGWSVSLKSMVFSICFWLLLRIPISLITLFIHFWKISSCSLNALRVLAMIALSSCLNSPSVFRMSDSCPEVYLFFTNWFLFCFCLLLFLFVYLLIYMWLKSCYNAVCDVVGSRGRCEFSWSCW